MRPKYVALLLSFFTIAALCFLRADDDDDQQGSDQVAYIRLIQGEVGYQRGDDNQGQWNRAAMNTPLMAGDALYANDLGRAEVQLGEGNFLRVGKQGYIGVLQSNDQIFQYKVASGTATLHLATLERSYEIDAPNLAFNVEKPGDYRVDVSAQGDTQLTLLKGRGAASITQHDDQVFSAPARLNVANDSAEFTVSKRINRDSWDRWCRQRDRLAYYSRPQYIPPGVYGYESMRGYGNWVEHPVYGSVWVPAMGPGWQPYRMGRWVWMDPYGWTWVSYEPWGWAPYHYGRWAYVPGTGWAWAPGPPTVRQRFAAALVAFLSGNEGGAWVGWFPLGPGEAYHPYVSREVYVVRPVTQYVNYNHVTVVNRTEIYNSNTVIYNTRVINQQVIEHTQVVSHCDVPPTRETLYTPAVQVKGTQVVNVTTVSRPAPRPNDQVIVRNVHVRTAEVPQVRPFEEKLAEMQKTGVVRPVNPYHPTTPVPTAYRTSGNTPSGGPAVTGNQKVHEDRGRHVGPEGMPPGLAKKNLPAASPTTVSPGATQPTNATQVPATSEDRARPGYQPPAEDEVRRGRQVGMPPGLAKKNSPASGPSTASPGSRAPQTTNAAPPTQVPATAEDRPRPGFQPPAAVERRIERPGANRSRETTASQSPASAESGPPAQSPSTSEDQNRPRSQHPSNVEERLRHPSNAPAVQQPERPKFEPPQAVDRRIGRPATNTPGGEEAKSSSPHGDVDAPRANQPRPAEPPREAVRPGFQPPQETDRRVNQRPAPEVPRQDTRADSPAPRPPEERVNPRHAAPPEAARTETAPSPPSIPARQQESAPARPADSVRSHEPPAPARPAQAGTGAPPDSRENAHQRARAESPERQSRPEKQADAPKPSKADSKQKHAEDEGHGKGKGKDKD